MNWAPVPYGLCLLVKFLTHWRIRVNWWQGTAETLFKQNNITTRMFHVTNQYLPRTWRLHRYCVNSYWFENEHYRASHEGRISRPWDYATKIDCEKLWLCFFLINTYLGFVGRDRKIIEWDLGFVSDLITWGFYLLLLAYRSRMRKIWFRLEVSQWVILCCNYAM